jgi:HSP20 family protein
MSQSAIVERDTPRTVECRTAGGAACYTPACDIYETAEEFVLVTDVPGVEPESVELRYENGRLSLFAPVADRQRNARYLLAEYGIGDYTRSFEVGERIDADRIAAEFQDGVLKVHLPKTAAAKPRKISIRTADKQ